MQQRPLETMATAGHVAVSRAKPGATGITPLIGWYKVQNL
jgi:hypothetical protein